MRPFLVGYGRVARAHIKAIQRHIRLTSGAGVAQDFVDDLIAHLEGFATGPLRGTARDDLRPGIRIIGWKKNVTILFAVDEGREKVTIVAVLYRGRNVETFFHG